MSVSFLAAAGAAAVAAVITGILVGRFARLPRLDLAAWMFAALGLTISLAAQALGYHRGFSPAAFRAVQVGARLAAPVALVWGLAELTGKGFWARFASRLALAALMVIAGVVLASDPLSGVPFTTAWPTARTYYQIIPNGVLLVVTVATALPALIALIVVAVRAQREPGWREALPAVAAAAVAVLALEALQVKLPVKSGYPAICLLAAALTWFAGQRSSRLQLAALHGVVALDDDTGSWDRFPDDQRYPDDHRYTGDGRYDDDTGSGRYLPDTGGFGRVSTDTDFGGLYRPDTGGMGRVGTDTDFGGLYRRDTGGFEEVGDDPGYGFYRTDTDLGPIINTGPGPVIAPDRDPSGPMPAIVETGDMLPVAFDVFTPAARGANRLRDEEIAHLYGQIAIYTLIEGHAEEFDRLAQTVVEKVKALEPDTLAYIVHGVPSAPMQRILYEVYRDEAAFSEHGHQPYIQDFEEERKPYVLATNVIELGVRQAKLLPLGDQPGRPRPPGQGGPPAPQGQQGLRGQRDPRDRPGPFGESGPFGQRGPARQPDPYDQRGPYGRPGPSGQSRPAGPSRQSSQPSPPRPAGPSGQPVPPRESGQSRPSSQPRPRPSSQPGPPRPSRSPGPPGQSGQSGQSGQFPQSGPARQPGPSRQPVPPRQSGQFRQSGPAGPPRPSGQPRPSGPHGQPPRGWGNGAR